MDSDYRCFRAKKRDTAWKMRRNCGAESSEGPPGPSEVGDDLAGLAAAVTRAARAGSRGRRAVDVGLRHSEGKQQAALRLVGEDEGRADLGFVEGGLRRRAGGGLAEDEWEEVDLFHRIAELRVDGVDEEVGDVGVAEAGRVDAV